MQCMSVEYTRKELHKNSCTVAVIMLKQLRMLVFEHYCMLHVTILNWVKFVKKVLNWIQTALGTK